MKEQELSSGGLGRVQEAHQATGLHYPHQL